MTVSICYRYTLPIGHNTVAGARRQVEGPQEAAPLLIRVPGLILKDEASELMRFLSILPYTSSSTYRETES